MPSLAEKILVLLALAASGTGARAQSATAARVEPGLETAVRWIWQVEPSRGDGWLFARNVLPELPVAVVPMAPAIPGVPRATMVLPAGHPDTYTIKRGDALIIISRRFKVPLPLLKEVNGLTTDNIRAGQVLRIPTPQEVQARAPVPTPTPRPAPGAKPEAKAAAPNGVEILSLQVFLDREQFSVGPIDGQNTPTFQKIVQLYQAAHPDVKEPAALNQRASAAVGEPLARYTLRPEDFRFIAPPKAERATALATPTPTPAKKRTAPPAPVVQQAKPSYQELSEAPMLAYRTPWEFVAERFHCNEAYLRSLNPQIRDVPTVGTELLVPNVRPFAIDRALAAPLQPPADPQNPVTASVVDLSTLQISRGGVVVAAVPLSMARPGLRGRDPWTVLGAIPRPQLSTMRELRVKPQPPTRMYGRESDPTPTPTPRPLVHQTLAAGPNNPVGVLWINLAKAGSTEPLPYGIHGTSIPDYMATQESIGGLRLTNWDVVRVAHLLPPGTMLEWKQGFTPPPPAAQPAH